MPNTSLYRRLAEHYRAAIDAGTLAQGARMPSLRSLMRSHDVSLSTALQLCRHLEAEGWLEARPRSGYFVRRPRRSSLTPASEPVVSKAPAAAEYVGVQARLAGIIERGQRHPVRINLAAAVGTPALYPEDALRRVATRMLRMHPHLLTQQAHVRGNPEFRAVVARRMLALGIAATAEEIVVTHGCTEALSLALAAVARPADTVAVESPTYYGLLQILESLGMRALEIPTSPHTGISIEALELALRTYSDIRAVVVTASLQNPLGATMPAANRQGLVELCAAHSLAVIEDDTYSGMAEAPASALKALDRDGSVIYCGSLNKVLAPGMRLGWLIAGRWQRQVELLKLSRTRYTEELSQLTAAEFVDSPAYDRHLRRLRLLLREQRERMAEAIAEYFPAGTRLSVPDGGVMLWVELPGHVCSERLFDEALHEGIKIAPGLMFSNSKRFAHYVRLNCGLPYSERLDAALRRLGALAGNQAPAGRPPGAGPIERLTPSAGLAPTA